jgi:hypothetical protein
MATLNLKCAWGATRQKDRYQPTTNLGDRYEMASTAKDSDREMWNFTAPGLTVTEVNAAIAELNNYSGATPFEWRARIDLPLKSYTCKGYEVAAIGTLHYNLSAVFVEWRGS